MHVKGDDGIGLVLVAHTVHGWVGMGGRVRDINVENVDTWTQGHETSSVGVGAPDLRQSTGAMETRWLLVFSLLIHGPLEGDGLASLKDEPCPTMLGHLPADLFPPKN